VSLAAALDGHAAALCPHSVPVRRLEPGPAGVPSPAPAHPGASDRPAGAPPVPRPSSRWSKRTEALYEADREPLEEALRHVPCCPVIEVLSMRFCLAPLSSAASGTGSPTPA
jgi:hypothetical protein